jgi:hypothetical protein
MNDAERAEEARQREFARLVAVELVTMIKQEIGSSVLKKILWLAAAVLFLMAVKFQVIRIPEAHGSEPGPMTHVSEVFKGRK